jgi:hypothetical protein
MEGKHEIKACYFNSKEEKNGNCVEVIYFLQTLP